jgi:hypothetical protein
LDSRLPKDLREADTGIGVDWSRGRRLQRDRRGLWPRARIRRSARVSTAAARLLGESMRVAAQLELARA